MKIFNNVVTKLGFRDRLRVLFGRCIYTQTAIDVDKECEVLNSTTNTFVDRILPRKVNDAQLSAYECTEQQDSAAESGGISEPKPDRYAQFSEDWQKAERGEI